MSTKKSTALKVHSKRHVCVCYFYIDAYTQKVKFYWKCIMNMLLFSISVIPIFHYTITEK